MKSTMFAAGAGLALVCALVMFPPLTRSGEVTEFTLAYATADMPSGIYFDRDFDWPTGEAVWVDVPAFALHSVLLGFCLLGVLHSSTQRVPDAFLDPE